MKKWLSYLIPCLLVPVVIVLGASLFSDKQYAFVSLCVAVLACVPFFLRFERRTDDTRRLVLVAAMVALAVVGRILCAPLPGFKPVTALVVITALYFGSEAGFMTGALSAVISNFYFGQGPWTPFQMFSWGIIGLLAGLFARRLRQSRIWLSAFGVLAGVLYSLLMDIWTVFWTDGYFNLTRYIAAVGSAAWFTAVYAVSNVIFLMLFAKPIGKILDRISVKYGISAKD